MCRILYTLEHGAVVTKPVAARWAQATLASRWRPLVQDALAWSPAVPPDREATLELLRFTAERGAVAAPGAT